MSASHGIHRASRLGESTGIMLSLLGMSTRSCQPPHQRVTRPILGCDEIAIAHGIGHGFLHRSDGGILASDARGKLAVARYIC